MAASQHPSQHLSSPGWSMLHLLHSLGLSLCFLGNLWLWAFWLWWQLRDLIWRFVFLLSIGWQFVATFSSFLLRYPIHSFAASFCCPYGCRELKGFPVVMRVLAKKIVECFSTCGLPFATPSSSLGWVSECLCVVPVGYYFSILSLRIRVTCAWGRKRASSVFFADN